MRSARSGLSQVRDSLSRRSHFSSWVVRWLGVLALGVTYVVTAQLCVYLANTGKNPAALWIPSGVALAALVRFGPRMWPGVFLGSLVANLLVDLSMPAALLLAGGNALDAWLSVWGIRRVTGERLDFGGTRHVRALDEPISVDGLQLRVGTSVGLASFPEDALDAADLVRRAHHAMYASKRQGGGFMPSASMEKLGAARRAPPRRP